jgi:hypothetical protein
MKAYWIGLEIAPNLHITIAINHMATDEDFEQLRMCLRTMIGPMLPIEIQKGEFKLRGYKNDVPTYTVRIVDERVDAIVKFVYKVNYKQKPEHTAYPELECHVTVDSDEKRRQWDQLEDIFWARSATLKEVGEKETIQRVNH